MERYAIISDIHGNLEALGAVLDDIQQQSVEQIICLGDIIGYGPNPCECIDLSMQFQFSLLGNHDNGALFDPEGFSTGAEKAIFWTRAQLESADGPEAKNRWDFLARLPRTKRDGKKMYVHGTPRSPLSEYVFPEDIYNTRKIERIFSFIQQYCFQGHTHVPGVFTESCRYLSPKELGWNYELNSEKVMINVGSVGQPRDNDPRSCYVIVDQNNIEFRRIDYPCLETRDKIYEIPELDNFLGDRLLEGR